MTIRCNRRWYSCACCYCFVCHKPVSNASDSFGWPKTGKWTFMQMKNHHRKSIANVFSHTAYNLLRVFRAQYVYFARVDDVVYTIYFVFYFFIEPKARMHKLTCKNDIKKIYIYMLYTYDAKYLWNTKQLKSAPKRRQTTTTTTTSKNHTKERK